MHLSFSILSAFIHLNHHLNSPFFLTITQEEEAKGHSHFGSSLAIPSVVWKADGALLAGAPWSRGRAALFVEVRCAFSELDDTYAYFFRLRLYMRCLRGVILTAYLWCTRTQSIDSPPPTLLSTICLLNITLIYFHDAEKGEGTITGLADVV
jgi:hypothetical protein